MSHAPLWFGEFPRSRRSSYPRLKGEHSARVVIIGGGLTGVACAFNCAGAGLTPILLDADVIGGGLTAGDTGILREGFAGSFEAGAKAHGLRDARNLWDGMRRGSLDFAAALRRCRISCGLQSQDVLTLAGPAPDDGRLLRREYETRRRAEVDSTWLTPAVVSRDAAVLSAGAIRTRAAVLDPYRACVGLAAAAASRGARIFEKSAVRRIRASRKHVDVVTDGGTVRAETVIIATSAPIQDLRALRRHLLADHIYGVVTAALPPNLRRQVGKRTAVLEDAGGGGRTIRWLADNRIFVQGGRQAVVPERARDRAIIQRTGQIMYELSLLYPQISGLPAERSWDAVDYKTADDLPLIGPHRNFPRHLFALGSARHGAGLAWTTARILLRHVLGESSKADEAFGFRR